MGGIAKRKHRKGPSRLVRLSITDLRDEASRRGGKCLDTVYRGLLERYRWRCAEGHEWTTTGNSVRNHKHWCPFCARVARLTIAEMHAIARSRGGECLSPEYLGGHVYLRWRCAAGHEFESMPYSVKAGKWCRACSGLEPLGLKTCRQLAARHGGRCLSTRYVNSREKMTWRCAAGHVFAAAADKVQQNRWCPTCAQDEKRIPFGAIQASARRRGGHCLSSEADRHTARDKLRWRCPRGHEWSSAWSVVSQGSWCKAKECRSADGKLALLRQVVAHDGGNLEVNPATFHYARSRVFLTCASGHKWRALPRDVISGRWCPTCTTGRLGERWTTATESFRRKKPGPPTS